MNADGDAPDGGYVTAEAAMVIPTLLLVCGLLVALQGVMTTQLRCVDAARAGAREVARGEAGTRVEAAVRAAAPVGASVEVSHDGDEARVDVSSRVGAVGRLFRGVTVGCFAVAVVEAEAS